MKAVSAVLIACAVVNAQATFESLADQDLIVQPEFAAPREIAACWKHIDFRGMGHLNRTCPEGEEESMGLCYKKCGAGAKGFGPLCINTCPADYQVSAGALCCKDQETCTDEIKDIAIRIPWDIARAVIDNSNPLKIIHDIRKLVHDLSGVVFKTCPI